MRMPPGRGPAGDTEVRRRGWTRRCVPPVAAALLFGGLAAPPAEAADSPPTVTPVLTRGFETARTVTLTFDAGSDDGDVASILATLRAAGITAGFGITGAFAERFPASTRAILDAGHQVINHSYSHPHMPALTPAERADQLDRTERALRALGADSAGWFRFPFKDGYADPGLNRELAQQGFWVNVDWTYDTLGWNAVSTATILDRVRRFTVPGAIFLGHVGAASTDAEALPQVIATLRSMGYGFTTPNRTVTLGGIRAAYLTVEQRLGVPTTLEMDAGAGRVQWFQRGRIYWSPPTGAHWVWGGILGRYVALGTVTGLLGFPVTDELPTPDRVGAFTHFQRGSIYWSPASDAHEVHGAIRDKWASMGWEKSVVGYPLSDEVAVVGGRASQFQRGNIYWSAGTGAHEVHGGIVQRYIAEGGTGSRLGLPTSDELATPTGARSEFAGGTISWNAATNTTQVTFR